MPTPEEALQFAPQITALKRLDAFRDAEWVIGAFIDPAAAGLCFYGGEPRIRAVPPRQNPDGTVTVAEVHWPPMGIAHQEKVVILKEAQ